MVSIWDAYVSLRQALTDIGVEEAELEARELVAFALHGQAKHARAWRELRLDAETRERLVPIEGQPVDLLNPPAGCPFAPRCQNCMKVCLREMPPRTDLSETHYSHCWLLQKEEFEKGGAGA